jgi:hypothetical protein
MKGWINSFIFLLGVFLFSSCEAQTNKITSNNNQVDSLRLISDSTFISKIKTFGIVANQEKKVGTLEYLIKDTPTKDNPYYIIQVGKLNNYRLEIFYNFYCYQKDGSVKLYDALNDTLIEAK